MFYLKKNLIMKQNHISLNSQSINLLQIKNDIAFKNNPIKQLKNFLMYTNRAKKQLKSTAIKKYSHIIKRSRRYVLLVLDSTDFFREYILMEHNHILNQCINLILILNLIFIFWCSHQCRTKANG